MRTAIVLFLVIGVMGALLWAGPAGASSIPIVSREEGHFSTNLSGEPNLRSPFILTIRSPEALDYALEPYERMKDRYTTERLNMFRRKLAQINLNSHMMLLVLSQPLEHFRMSLLGVEKTGNEPIKVRVSYRHDTRMVRKYNQKNVYYIMIVIPKSGLPPQLVAVEDGRGKDASLQAEEVTGVLMEFGDGKAQLVVEKTARGKKSTFYLKDADVEDLRRYFGKKVTVEGHIKPEGLSAYESEMTFLRIVKVFNGAHGSN